MATVRQVEAEADDTEAYPLLERHSDNWRRQLWLKGRNMTVGQLVYSMRADGTTDDPAAAARDFGLPVEQVEQAVNYYRKHKRLIEAEADEEKRWLADRGFFVEPQR